MIPEIWSVTDRIFSHFDHFLPFYPTPPKPNESKFWKKRKKNLRNAILLHKCTINDNHMIYGSRDINYTRQIFLFWATFCPNCPKNENVKKMKKKAWRYHHLTQVYQKS